MVTMKPNILFINPPTIPLENICASFSGENKICQPTSMPLGIMYSSSYLKKHNDVGNIGILDYVLNMKNMSEYQNTGDFIRKVVKKEINFVPDILAFSLIFSASHYFFNLCVKILKSIWPNAITIVGGTHATNCTKFLLENVNVDYVVRGEGEIAFSEFIKQYSNFQNIKVKGIYSRKNLNTNYPFEVGDYIEDLDIIPFPDWKLINMSKYMVERGRRLYIGDVGNAKMAALITTRGCPFRCIYCSSHTVHGRRVRYRSNENVIAEIKFLHDNYGVTLFIPEDDLFAVNKKRILNLLSSIKDLKIPNFVLQIPSALCINLLDEQIIDALVDVGMKIAYLPIESGCEYVQKFIIKKNVNLKKAKKFVKYFQKKGLVVRCYFILGFPAETKEQMIETIEFAKSLRADWCNFIIATPLLGTEMYKKFVEMGSIEDDINTWANAIFDERKFDTPEITANELNELAYRANLNCNFINNPNKINGRFDNAIMLYKDILSRHPYHIIALYCIMECYQLNGNLEKAEHVIKKISLLIKNDVRAKEIFIKYGDLMPNFKADETIL